MRKITKKEGFEPPELTNWKHNNPNGKYKNDSDTFHDVRKAIRNATRKEQFGLCAYCCQEIDDANSMNEHVEAQSLAPNRTLDFSNIVASCTTQKRCDKAHGSQPLPLTPLMDECETELKFYFSGKVEGLTDRARKSIDVLGLNSNAIREERKQMIENLLFTNTPNDVNSSDNDLIAALLNPTNGQLQAYSPVLVNVLRQKRCVNFISEEV